MLYLLLNCFIKEKSLQVQGLCFFSLICHRMSISHWGSPKMQYTQEIFHDYPKYSQNLRVRTMHLALFLIVSTMNRSLLVTVNGHRPTPCTIPAVLEFCRWGRYKWSSTNCIKHISPPLPLYIHVHRNKLNSPLLQGDAAFFTHWKDYTSREGENGIAYFNLFLLLLK